MLKTEIRKEKNELDNFGQFRTRQSINCMSDATVQKIIKKKNSVDGSIFWLDEDLKMRIQS